MPAASTTDVAIVGGGIVGACCARTLAEKGYSVTVIDAGLRNATAAGMGHLLILDDNPAELAITRYSLRRWREICPSLPEAAAWRQNGTLWMAASDEEMAVAEKKYTFLQAQGIACELLTGQQLIQIEPMVREGLNGGLLIRDDGILYAPVVANWMLEHPAITRIAGRVSQIDEPVIHLDDGRLVSAPKIILVNGIQAPELLPGLPIEPKKGHLLITDRYPSRVTRTLVELGYVTSAHNATGPSTACNIQQRPTGQFFIGATRQFGTTDPAVESWMLSKMLRRAVQYVPALSQMNASRAWTGFRAATPDGMPMIGCHPSRPGLWLAVGHEGLGVTTATATADLLLAEFSGETVDLDATPFSPARFLNEEVVHDPVIH